MSLSNPLTISENPIQAYVKFKGDIGKIEYSPKDKTKPETTYEYDKLSFVVLDDTIGTITGFKKDPISSNKIKMYDQESSLNVFLGKSPLASGKWSEIKEKVKNAGGNFTKLIYCYCLETGELVEISVAKGKLLKWNQFLEKLSVKEGAGIGFKFTDIKEEVAGNTKYFDYNFMGRAATDEKVLAKAKELDTTLQNYLNTIINGKQQQN